MTDALATTAETVRTEIDRLTTLLELGPCDPPPFDDTNDWRDPDWLDRWMRATGMIPTAIRQQQQILERINHLHTITSRRKP